MPYADHSLRPWILAQLGACCDLGALESAVDVGAGAGTAPDFYRPHMPAVRWTAIEIWPPYVDRFSLRGRYSQVIVSDVRDLDPLPEADLYLFGDVLEHMPAADAVKVWDRAREASRWLVINLPVLDYPQGMLDGNPHEEHLAQWDMDSVLGSFAGITAWTGPAEHGSRVGAFIAGGLR